VVKSMINLSLLPKETRDQIELKEATDMTFNRFVDEAYSDIWWNLLAERADPDYQHSMLASLVGGQGSGKSNAAISMCCFMDPTFNVDRIYFGYDELVKDRHKLQPNTAVLVDEQSELFGLDSHRVSIVLQNLKEQLRKKSIHFFFCSPTLYPESKTSMYIIETMFIDFEEQECYAALKTREGLTLGHIKIPHPLKILEDGSSYATQELMDAYEERAQMVMENKLFQRAEKVYVNKMGYIPQSTLIQIINKIYPEYHAGVVPLEIAGRIKLDKELSGEWEVSGRSVKKEDRSRKPLKKPMRPMRLMRKKNG